VVGHPDVLDKIVVGKQATDLCTPPFTQRIAARYIEKGLLDPKIEEIRKMYSVKQKGFLQALDNLCRKRSAGQSRKADSS
jgi:2-aminoadipate transaminase